MYIIYIKSIYLCSPEQEVQIYANWHSKKARKESQRLTFI